MQFKQKYKEVNLVFPHQLFKDVDILKNGYPIILIEEFLFFRNEKFHKQKLLFHRLSMKSYELFLRQKGLEVFYIESINPDSDIRKLLPKLNEMGVSSIHFSNLYDNWLNNRIEKTSEKNNIQINICTNNYFFNDPQNHINFFDNKKNFFHNSFYVKQRKDNQILIENEEPIGGRWSFDHDNRKKYPKDKRAPQIPQLTETDLFKKSCDYIETNFINNPGDLSDHPLYPYDFKSSERWMEAFFVERFTEFGAYEDAIVKDESFLNHSVLSPLLNSGLLTPKTLVEYCLSFSKQNNVPINSVEGFIRQIIGWREYVVNVYLVKGAWQRNQNYFHFKRDIPNSFYDGSTGIEPIDFTIKKLLKTGYSHHIERLMILGNFMLLCEFHPNSVYKWFMEMYVDAYDWVMVPNIYGMSQFSDGGLMMTKPYISGSNYIKKMSDYKKGDWCEIWDALYWNFIDKHSHLFKNNFRMKFMINLYNKKSLEQRLKIKEVSSNFLADL